MNIGIDIRPRTPIMIIVIAIEKMVKKIFYELN